MTDDSSYISSVYRHLQVTFLKLVHNEILLKKLFLANERPGGLFIWNWNS